MRISGFGAQFYVPSWLKASCGADASRSINYFLLIPMFGVRNVDKDITDVVNKKLLNQWYLSEESIPFALFIKHLLMH